MNWTPGKIMKLCAVIICAIINILVSLLTFFSSVIPQNVLGGLLMINVGCLALYRSSTSIEDFLKIYQSDSSTMKVKLDSLASFLGDIHSIRDELNSMQSKQNEPIQPDPPREIVKKTPRYRAVLNKELNIIEVSQEIDDIPSPRTLDETADPMEAV